MYVSGGMKAYSLVGCIHSPDTYKQGRHEWSQALVEYGLGVKKWCFSDTGVPRKKAGEAAMTMTHLPKQPEGHMRSCDSFKVVWWLDRKSACGVALALPSLPERVRFTVVWNN